MKKYFLLTTMLLMVSFFMTSCDKDGIYNPKQKISKIYQDEGGKKVLSQTWSWNGDLLALITYDSLGLKYDEFEYTDNQITKSISYNEGLEWEYTIYTYDKSLLQSYKTYNKDGKEIESAVIEHTKKKITKITITSTSYDEQTTNMAKSMQPRMVNNLRFILPSHVVNSIQNNLQKSTSSIVTVEFEYDGSNISTYTYTTKSDVLSITYTYDKYNNPLYDAIEISESALSKNNMLTESITSQSDPNYSKKYTYEYVYVDKFPTEVKATTTVMGHSIVTKFYYEYLTEK